MMPAIFFWKNQGRTGDGDSGTTAGFSPFADLPARLRCHGKVSIPEMRRYGYDDTLPPAVLRLQVDWEY
jgi:hypothetical protein